MVEPFTSSRRLASFQEISKERSRIMLPVKLECKISSDRLPAAEEFPQSLQLLHGHCLIFAWWLATFEALTSKDQQDKFELLMECALTPTLLLRVLNTTAECAAASCHRIVATCEIE